MKKELRERVWNKYSRRCAYCGNKLRYKDMQVDHLIPRRGGRANKGVVEKFENYMPSCWRCNNYKRNRSLETFRRLLKTLHKRLDKLYLVKVAHDYGMLAVTKFDGVFWFEMEEK